MKKQVSKQVNKYESMTLIKRVKSSHGLERVKTPNGDSIFDILSGGTFSLEFLSICRVFDFTQNEQKFTLYHFSQISDWEVH